MKQKSTKNNIRLARKQADEAFKYQFPLAGIINEMSQSHWWKLINIIIKQSIQLFFKTIPRSHRSQFGEKIDDLPLVMQCQSSDTKLFEWIVSKKLLVLICCIWPLIQLKALDSELSWKHISGMRSTLTSKVPTGHTYMSHVVNRLIKKNCELAPL